MNRILDLVGRYPTLQGCAETVAAAATLMIEAFSAGGKLMVAGNGGSAADADHISSELLKGFTRSRRLRPEDQALLGEGLASKLQGGLPAIPLPQFTALATAFANDCDAEYTFAQLVFALGKPGDVLMAISTSGNSKNIIHAVDVAKAKGIKVIALTGSGNGRLTKLADVAICAPAYKVYAIQEYHLPIYHTLCLTVEDAFFPD